MNYNDELETTVISTVEDMSFELSDKWHAIVDLLGWDGTADEAQRVLECTEKILEVSIVGDAATYFIEVINDQYKELASAWFEIIQNLDESDLESHIRRAENVYSVAWS